MELIALLLTQIPQAAPAPQEAHRPEEIEVLRTKTAYTLRADALEADLVVAHLEFEETHDRPDLIVRSLQAQFAFGVTDWLTGEVDVPFLDVDADPGDTERGLGDIGLELKAAVSRDLVPFDLAVGLRVTLTTGDEEEGLGQDNSRFQPFAAASYVPVEGLTAHAQIHVLAEEDQKTVYGINLAADATPWGPDLSLFLALNGRREVGESPAWAIVPGAEYRWREKRLSFAVGLPIGMSSRAEDFGFLGNAQYRF
jgi:hypothetical protein